MRAASRWQCLFGWQIYHNFSSLDFSSCIMRWLITRRVRNKAKFSVAYFSFRVSYLQGWDCRRAPKFIRLQVIERGKWWWVARDNLTRDWDSWEIISIFYPTREWQMGYASRGWMIIKPRWFSASHLNSHPNLSLLCHETKWIIHQSMNCEGRQC